MNILVTAASKYGSTREIANIITNTLGEEGFTVLSQDVEDVLTLKGFDAVIIGSAIYTGNCLPEAKRFVDEFRSELENLPIFVFSSGPVGDNPPLPQDPAVFTNAFCNLPVREYKSFGGKLDPENLNFAERLITKALHAPTGDFRNWAEIRAWAHKLAAQLRTESIPTV